LLLVQYNVAQLLKSPVGATRTYDIDEPFGPSEEVTYAGNIQGQVRLTRVNNGIVVRAALHAPVTLECSRCLEPFVTDLDLGFEERFIPAVDVYTGVPVHEVEEDEDDEDVYMLDAHHELDLHEAVRQQAVMAVPMQPVHTPDCAGLCPICGINRNEQQCDCQGTVPADPRLAGLRILLAGDRPIT
jgi:uncharacterized protein